MLTVGPSRSEVVGQVNGEEIYHASLAPQEYETALNDLGLAVVEFAIEDAECDRQTVLLARRKA